MKQSNYSEKLKHPKWQKKRLEIMKRDEFMCQSCGSSEDTLNVHHLKYIRNIDIYDYPEQFLLTLCETCHNKRHFLNDEINTVLAKFRDNVFVDDILVILKTLEKMPIEDFIFARQLSELYNRHNGI